MDAVYLLGRLLKHSWREPIWLAIEIIQPMVWIVLYGQLFEKVTLLPGFGAASYIQFLTPGVIVMTALFGSAWAGMTFIEDYREGVMDRLLSAPIRRQSIVLAKALHAALAVAVQAVILMFVGALLGAKFMGGVPGILFISLAMLLISGAFSAASNGLALLTRTEDTLIAVVSFVTLPLTFLSASLMSSALMPAWMQEAARFNPINWAVEASRAGLNGTITGASWLAIGYLAAFLVVGNLFAGYALRRFQARS